jgi:hypothetical protein
MGVPPAKLHENRVGQVANQMPLVFAKAANRRLFSGWVALVTPAVLAAGAFFNPITALTIAN